MKSEELFKTYGDVFELWDRVLLLLMSDRIDELMERKLLDAVYRLGLAVKNDTGLITLGNLPNDRGRLVRPETAAAARRISVLLIPVSGEFQRWFEHKQATS